MRIRVVGAFDRDLLDVSAKELACELLRTLASEAVVGIHLLPLDPLEHEDALGHVRPDHLRDDEIVVIGQEARDHLGVVRLLDEVELGAKVLLELVRQRSRLNQLRPLGSPLEQLGGLAQEGQVELDLVFDPGTTDLDDHLATALEQRGVNLCNGGGREGFGIDPHEDIGGEIVRDHLLDLGKGHRRNLVDQLAELLDVDVWKEIRPGGEQLSQLDVGGAELFQRLPELLRALGRGRAVPPDSELAQNAQEPAPACYPTDVQGTPETLSPNAHQGESVRGFRLGNAWASRADARESGRRLRDAREGRARRAQRRAGRRGSSGGSSPDGHPAGPQLHEH